MTREEAVQALVDAGWPLLTAQQAVDNLDPPVSSPTAGRETVGSPLLREPLVNQVELDRLLETGPPVEGGESVLGPPPVPLAEGDINALALQGLQKQADPRPNIQASVTEEEQAEIDALSPGEYNDATTLLAELAGLNDQFNYDWVHEVVTVGSLDSNEALIAFYQSFVEIQKPTDVKTDKDEIVVEAKSILSRGRINDNVGLALKDWGEKSGNYDPTEKTDEVLNTDISAMMSRYGISKARATTIGRVANTFDIEPLDLGEIWEGFDRKDEGQAVPIPAGQAVQGRGFGFGERIFGLADVAKLYKQGLALYDQSHLMAAVHLKDPALAQRLRADPYSLDAGELREALDAVGGGEGGGDPQVNWIRERLAGGFRASDEVDKEAMRNAVQVLADGWNLTGTEAIIGALTSELVSQTIARVQASLPNPFGPLPQGVALTDTIQDQAAHVKRRLRETPEYKELFSNLQGGESEEEFVRRFETRSQEILGDDVVGAVRNAMRTGNVNTIFQQGLNTPVGESSTRFQEIMARNAQTFRDML